MLFNSIPFVFGFLPVTLLGFFHIARHSRMLASLWLALASLFFYGWWNANFVGLLLASVILNYGAGYLISLIDPDRRRLRTLLLGGAIAANLSLLAYYKYIGFFAAIISSSFGTKPSLGSLIVLPLGISFFTFTQIAFLVDTYRGEAREFNFLRYLLFVVYFPHLIAGPILHHNQIMPQFADPRIYAVDWSNIARGLTYFIIGLGKKVIIADFFAKIASPIFSSAHIEPAPSTAEAWAAALAYTLQLYFDFSGYSDMAIGLSLAFNIRLPINFNSPYKASNIIDFWRRWHMTLSAFLRDYLYIPLGGNRAGGPRRYANIFVTMVLGGLWHGAGWTFVAWGALHGVYLIINHAFRGLCHHPRWPSKPLASLDIMTPLAGVLTFLAIVVGWVVFRADSLTTAGIMLRSMVGGTVTSGQGAFKTAGLETWVVVSSIGAGLGAVWFLPNTQEFMGYVRASDGQASSFKRGIVLAWQPERWWTWICAGLLCAICVLMMSPRRVSEFLYYQF